MLEFFRNSLIRRVATAFRRVSNAREAHRSIYMLHESITKC